MAGSTQQVESDQGNSQVTNSGKVNPELKRDIKLNAGLQKLQIISYADISDKNSILGTFTAYFNPDSFNVRYSIESSNAAAIAAKKNNNEYVATNETTYTFDLIFDGTGASGPKIDVYNTIDFFLEMTYRFYGKEHKTPTLTISWGDIQVDCKLDSVSVNYDLFSPTGIPIRAKVSTSFSLTTSQQLHEAEERRSSPDLTHTRMVKAGDTLPLMCRDIYKNEALYLAVAKVNGLANYRNLKPGTELFFPPLDKLA